MHAHEAAPQWIPPPLCVPHMHMLMHVNIACLRGRQLRRSIVFGLLCHVSIADSFVLALLHAHLPSFLRESMFTHAKISRPCHTCCHAPKAKPFGWPSKVRGQGRLLVFTTYPDGICTHMLGAGALLKMQVQGAHTHTHTHTHRERETHRDTHIGWHAAMQTRTLKHKTDKCKCPQERNGKENNGGIHEIPIMCLQGARMERKGGRRVAEKRRRMGRSLLCVPWRCR
eukprot:1160349-Pelagomonas_calceolata.AAC.4